MSWPTRHGLEDERDPRFEGDDPSYRNRHPAGVRVVRNEPLAVALESLASDLEREASELGCSVDTAHLKIELAKRIRKVVRGA